MHNHNTQLIDTDAIEALVSLPFPYASLTTESETIFQLAMQQADAWHCQNNPAYASLFNTHASPIIPVGLFKTENLATAAGDNGVWLNSSGSSQQGKTRVFFDTQSLNRIQRGMMAIFQHSGLISTTPSRFLLLSPDPTSGDHAGYATAFLKFTQCAPVQECLFSVSASGQLDTTLAWSTLQRWALDPAPIYIFGLTLYFEQLCLTRPAPFALQGTVKGLTGGGWKGMTQHIDRKAIITELNDTLESPLTDIRDIYGMTEHPLHYISCPEGHFHIPAYSRFSIIGEDGTPVADGHPGLILLENPFFASLPAQRLLSQDIGTRGEYCPCGDPLPYLRYLNRASSLAGTCAATINGL